MNYSSKEGVFTVYGTDNDFRPDWNVPYTLWADQSGFTVSNENNQFSEDYEWVQLTPDTVKTQLYGAFSELGVELQDSLLEDLVTTFFKAIENSEINLTT